MERQLGKPLGAEVLEHKHLGGDKHQGAVEGGRGLAGPEHADEWQPCWAAADTVTAAEEDIGGPHSVEGTKPEDTGCDHCVSDRRLNCGRQESMEMDEKMRLLETARKEGEVDVSQQRENGGARRRKKRSVWYKRVRHTGYCEAGG